MVFLIVLKKLPPPNNRALLPVTVQLPSSELATPPPCEEAELPDTTQLFSVPEKTPPPIKAKFPPRIQFVRAAEYVPPPKPESFVRLAEFAIISQRWRIPP